MLKLIPTIFLGFALILGFLVNPVTAKEDDWDCVALDLEDFTFDGGDTANIHLSSYSYGDDYDVEFNASKTVAKGETGDGTSFTCSLKGAPAIPSEKNKTEVIPFNDLMSLMENKKITYTGSSHADRPMKVTKENGKWQMEQTEAGEVSEIISGGKNKIKMEDYPSRWIINGTWKFSKSGTKCQINHTDDKDLTMYWKCAPPAISSAKKKSKVFSFVHTDPEWKDGKGDVPDKGVCLKHGGKSWSLSLKISGIPRAAKSIRLRFTDDDYGNEGGHGDFTVKLNGQTTIEIPPIGGDKDYLPANITGGNGHHCGSCSEGDYLGPCSGGRGHTYRVNIYARDAEQEILAKGTILLGNF